MTYLQQFPPAQRLATVQRLDVLLQTYIQRLGHLFPDMPSADKTEAAWNLAKFHDQSDLAQMDPFHPTDLDW